MARVLAISLNPALDLSIRLDALQPGEVNRARETRMDAAGKGLNVARVLAALGHEVTLSGLLGEDNQAAFVTMLAQAGIADAFVRVPGATRINAKLSEADGRVTDLNGPGLGIGLSDWQALTQRLESLFDGCDALVLTGSLPPGVSPIQQAALIEQAQRRGVPVWLDSSGPALGEAIAAAPQLVKPNADELAEWIGHALPDAASRLAAADAALARGVGEVLLSLGADGVVWRSRGETLTAQPPKVDVVSTVCAGDTLLAGTLHGVLSGWAREDSLRYATALAAECVRHVGVGDPRASDFPLLHQQTRVQTDPAARIPDEVPA